MSEEVTYNVKNVDRKGNFDVPPNDVYTCEIDVADGPKPSSKGNPMIEIQYVIVGGKYKGSRLWDYLVLTENQQWKLGRFVDAIGLPQRGKLDPAKLLGKRVKVQTRIESSNEFADRARVHQVLSLDGQPDEEAEEDDVEEEPEDDGETAEGGDYTVEDIQGMNKTALRDLIEEEELEIRVTKQTKLPRLRARVIEELGIEEGEGESDGEGEEPEDVEEVEDYNDLDVATLRNEAKERGLSIKGTKKALVRRLEKDDEEEGEEPF